MTSQALSAAASQIYITLPGKTTNTRYITYPFSDLSAPMGHGLPATHVPKRSTCAWTGDPPRRVLIHPRGAAAAGRVGGHWSGADKGERQMVTGLTITQSVPRPRSYKLANTTAGS